MIEWTKEKLAVLSDSAIESLRDNAIRLQKREIVAMCDEALVERKPVREKKISTSIPKDHAGQYVSEFHFVCPSELGVEKNADGTIWTGTWVVAQEHAEAAVTHGSIVALHSSKANASYLQGVVKSWRRSDRQALYTGEQLTQTETGIDFLFYPSELSLEWKGDATGEKGYAWAPTSSLPNHSHSIVPGGFDVTS